MKNLCFFFVGVLQIAKILENLNHYTKVQRAAGVIKTMSTLTQQNRLECHHSLVQKLVYCNVFYSIIYIHIFGKLLSFC